MTRACREARTRCTSWDISRAPEAVRAIYDHGPPAEPPVRPAVAPETAWSFHVGVTWRSRPCAGRAQLPAMGTLEARNERSTWGRRRISHPYCSHYSFAPVIGVSGHSAALQRARGFYSKWQPSASRGRPAAAGTAQRRRPARLPAAVGLDSLCLGSPGHSL